MTTSTRLLITLVSLAAALAFAGCSSTSEETGILAMNLRTGDTRSFETEDDVPLGWIVCPDGGCPAPAACGALDEADCLARQDCSPIYAEGRPDGAATVGGVGR